MLLLQGTQDVLQQQGQSGGQRSQPLRHLGETEDQAPSVGVGDSGKEGKRLRKQLRGEKKEPGKAGDSKGCEVRPRGDFLLDRSS